MNKKIKLVLAIRNILLVLASFYFCFYLLFPYLLNCYDNYSATKSVGWVHKKLKVGNDTVAYVEKGEGPCVLLIHGFENEKKFWAPYIGKIGKNYHYIALDLPGHGDSTVSEKHHFDIFNLARNVKEFVEQKQIKDFHLIGSSLGGGVVIAYATAYPEDVKSLLALNPFGANPKVINATHQGALDGTNNVFIPRSLKALDVLTNRTIGRSLRVPAFFKWLFYNNMKMKIDFYDAKFQEMLKTRTVEPYLSSIQAPVTLCIGENDAIVHPTTGDVIEEELIKAGKKVNKVVIKNGTHVFVDQAFDEVIRQISLHLEKYESADQAE